MLIELKVLINFVRCRKQTGKKTNLDRVRFCFNGLVCWCGLHEGKGPSDFSVLWEWSFFFGNIYNFMIFNVYTLFFQTSKKHLGGEWIKHRNLHRNNVSIWNNNTRIIILEIIILETMFLFWSNFEMNQIYNVCAFFF